MNLELPVAARDPLQSKGLSKKYQVIHTTDVIDIMTEHDFIVTQVHSMKPRVRDPRIVEHFIRLRHKDLSNEINGTIPEVLVVNSNDGSTSLRMDAAQQLQKQYEGVVVLKGAGTLVVAEDQLPAVCDRGNPGMAVPGMGDVLTGIIAGIAAQQEVLNDGLLLAARAGVYVHALVGDLAARRGERGLVASDLFEYLPGCVNP